MASSDWLEAAREIMAEATSAHHLDVQDMTRCICGEWSDVEDDDAYSLQETWDYHMAKVAVLSLVESGLIAAPGDSHITEWAVQRPDGRIISASYDESYAREAWADVGGRSSGYALVRREMPPWQETR